MSRQEQDEGFLSRWARRKAQEKSAEQPAEQPREQPGKMPEEPPQSESSGEPGQEPAPAEAQARAVAPEAEVAPEDLPNPETLGRDDDWSPFLKRSVPAEVRTQALRRLWRVDPVFANLDGLVDYADDYNGPQFTGKPVKTLFKVGRGMLVDEEPLDSQPQVEVAEEMHSLPEENAEVPAPEAAEQSESSQPPDDAEASESADAPQTREEAPVRDDPPRRRRALAKRWGIESGADRQNS